MKKLHALKNAAPVALILVLFSAYWCVTLVYNFPDSSVVHIENYKKIKALDQIMYQRWSFFAPPPVSNRRLELQYVNTKGGVKEMPARIELFGSLYKSQNASFPFNDAELNTSWTYFGKTEEMYSVISKYKSLVNSTVLKDSVKRRIAKGRLSEIVAKTDGFQYIATNARKMYQKSGLKGHDKFIITIYEEQIPSYANRYKQEPAVLDYTFQSDPLPL